MSQDNETMENRSGRRAAPRRVCIFGSVQMLFFLLSATKKSPSLPMILTRICFLWDYSTCFFVKQRISMNFTKIRKKLIKHSAFICRFVQLDHKDFKLILHFPDSVDKEKCIPIISKVKSEKRKRG